MLQIIAGVEATLDRLAQRGRTFVVVCILLMSDFILRLRFTFLCVVLIGRFSSELWSTLLHHGSLGPPVCCSSNTCEHLAYERNASCACMCWMIGLRGPRVNWLRQKVTLLARGVGFLYCPVWLPLSSLLNVVLSCKSCEQETRLSASCMRT